MMTLHFITVCWVLITQALLLQSIYSKFTRIIDPESQKSHYVIR